MKEEFKKILDAATKLANTAVQKTADIVEKGRMKIEQQGVEKKIEKMQQRLGVLVYTMVKTGESNAVLTKKYVEEIDFLYAQLTAYTGEVAAQRETVQSKDVFVQTGKDEKGDDVSKKQQKPGKAAAETKAKPATAKKVGGTKKATAKKAAPAKAKKPAKAKAEDGAVFLAGDAEKLPN